MKVTAPDNLYLQIQEELATYSRAYRQLAGFILKQTFAASSMNIETLAESADVSVATVNRFARHCGYDGYPQFKKALHALFNHVFEPVRKAHTLQKNIQEVVSQSLGNTSKNIEKTQQMLDPVALDRIVDMMLAAKNIFVAGMGVSALHASFLVDALEPYLQQNQITELTSFCGAERAFRRAAMLTEQDLVIAISLPRYSQSTIELVGFSRKQGCKILSLTDQLTSPLVPFSNETLLASSHHPLLYAANAPMIALIEVLTMAVISRLDNFAECVARQTETVLPYFYLPNKE